jgi:hypothetical protein
MDQWRFYAEVGASNDAGGEFVVRSVNGAASVNRPITAGALFRMGYDPEQQPQLLALQNTNRSPINISNTLSETQKRMLSAAAANPQGMMQGSFDSESTVPNYSGAAAPTSGTSR